jgi:hypothetical protein
LGGPFGSKSSKIGTSFLSLTLCIGFEVLLLLSESEEITVTVLEKKAVTFYQKKQQQTGEKPQQDLCIMSK